MRNGNQRRERRHDNCRNPSDRAGFKTGRQPSSLVSVFLKKQSLPRPRPWMAASRNRRAFKFAECFSFKLISWTGRPISMYHLATGCTLLISGSLSDFVGSKNIFLIGCFTQGIFSLACGLSRTGTELIIFRILSGLAMSLCLPSAVSLITENFYPGKLQNMAFGCMGGGQPIGFGLGLTLGGIFTDTVGWPWTFHCVAIANAIVLVLAGWQLPSKSANTAPVTWRRLAFEIDWIGATIISTSLAMISYLLACVDFPVLPEPLTLTNYRF